MITNSHPDTQIHSPTDRQIESATKKLIKKNRIKVRETDKQMGKQANRQ